MPQTAQYRHVYREIFPDEGGYRRAQVDGRGNCGKQKVPVVQGLLKEIQMAADGDEGLRTVAEGADWRSQQDSNLQPTE
jgi:hypothetical protein